MINLDDLLGQSVKAELSAKTEKSGILIDYGDDLFVLYDGRSFFYIPFTHLQELRLSPPGEYPIQQPDDSLIAQQSSKITFREMMQNATGKFVEIWATGRQPVHGYLTHLLDDYLVLTSPVYSAMYLSLDHLKWLIPYDDTHTPYSLHMPSSVPHVDPNRLSPTFEDQVKRFEGNLVVFNIGEMTDKIGLLQKVNANRILEVIAANGETVYLNLHHIKTMHIPVS